MDLVSVNRVIAELDNLSKCLNRKPSFVQCIDCLKSVLSAVSGSVAEIEALLQRPQLKRRIGRIKLCASQITKTLPPLVNEIAHARVQNVDVVTILIEKLRWCMTEVVAMTEVEDDLVEAEEVNFVRLMDSAIGLLNSDRHSDDGYRPLVEDLLCRALTIAQLSCQHDYDEITASCRNVLSAVSTILDEKCGELVYKDYLLSTLEALERRVNVAVLRLALHSFSEPFVILKGLVKKCRESEDSAERCASDLEDMISCFDLYCDRVHLIGNFAVACSENKKVILSVESCLASLDFCEKYLVLAVTSFYLDPTNPCKRAYLKFFVDGWHAELMMLNSLLDDIIDTSAFVQVAQEDMHEFIDKIKCALSDGEGAEEAIGVFIKRGKKVVEHVNRSAEEEVRNSSFVLDLVADLSSGLRDLSPSMHKSVAQLNEPNFMNKLEMVVSHLEKLSNYLNQFIVSTSMHKLSFASSCCKFSDSVGDLPMDVSNASDKESSAAKGMDWLKTKFFNEGDSRHEDSSLAPYLSRALEKSIHRSTFYSKTPNRSNRAHNREMFNVSDILEHLTGLDDTFFSDSVGGLCSKSVAYDEKRDETSGKRSIASDVALLSTLASDISKINSLERLNDINRVEDKLRELKSNS